MLQGIVTYFLYLIQNDYSSMTCISIFTFYVGEAIHHLRILYVAFWIITVTEYMDRAVNKQ